ncbi:TPA: PH domain-containing protein [Vibrio vulnificus]|nr:PH domain-containing protein [Vibrio vulnificus]
MSWSRASHLNWALGISGKYLETNIMKDIFKPVLDDNEEILWVGKPYFIAYLLNASFVFFCGILLFLFLGRSSSELFSTDPVQLLSEGCVMWFGLALILYKLLVYPNTFYAYSNKRLLFRSGFMGIDYKVIDYDKITNVEVNINPIESLFNVGTIKVFCGEVGGKGQKITNDMIAIPYPNDTFRNIKQVSIDVKSDLLYPNSLRPEDNPGYETKYKK